MNRIRNIIRISLLLLIILLLIYLNQKTGVDFGTIAKFKVETFNKTKQDSLKNTDKVALLIDETTKFNERIEKDSSHAQRVIYPLAGIVTLFLLSELLFYSRKKTP